VAAAPAAEHVARIADAQSGISWTPFPDFGILDPG
jgi:hypothetical protein